jgi:hypothetical protein
MPAKKKIKPTKTDINKKAMLLALEKSLGIVTTAAKIANIDRSVHYDWMDKDPVYKKAVESIADMTLDFAESQLHKQIKDGEVTSTIFYLKTKGKRRGYIEKTETDVNLTNNISDLGLPDFMKKK